MRRSKGIRTVAAPSAADSILRPSIAANGARSISWIKPLRSWAAIQCPCREFDAASLSASATASTGVSARCRPSISVHEFSATIGLPNFFAKPISANVPPSPASAITASALATITALRASPMPVAIANSMWRFAALRSWPGRIPIVCPPALRAPAAADSITPVRPPFISTAPRRAISWPSSNASLQTARGASPAPMTATTFCRFTETPPAELFLDAERGGQFREVRDDDIGSGYSFGQLAIARANPRRMHPDALAAEHVVERSVADEENIGGLEFHQLENFPEDERVRFSISGVGRDDHGIEDFADAGVVHNQVAGLGIVEVGNQAEAVLFGD